jgi:hypothetical protein
MNTKATPESPRVSAPGARWRSVFLFTLLILSGFMWFVSARFSVPVCSVVSGIVFVEWLLSLMLKRHFLTASCVLLFLVGLVLSVWR